MSPRSTLRAVLVIVSLLLAWTSLAHSAEIHDAARATVTSRRPC